MRCHILPMVYLDDWSTETTKGKDRDKRFTYYYPKNEVYGIYKKTEHLNFETVVIDNLYILNDSNKEKIIEEGLSLKFEQKFKKSITNIDLSSDKTYNLDFLISFISIQLFRQPKLIKRKIGDAEIIVDNALKDFPIKFEKTDKNKKFLEVLCRYFENDKTTPINATEEEIRCKYDKFIFIAPDNIDFIASDFPVSEFIIDNEEIKFMALNRRICIVLYKGLENVKYKSNATIKRVTENMVKYINHIMFETCEQVVFYKKSKIRKLLSSEFPKEEFLRIIDKTQLPWFCSWVFNWQIKINKNFINKTIISLDYCF